MPPSSSSGSFLTETDDSSDSSSNSGSRKILPLKVLIPSQPPVIVVVPRGKNPIPEDDYNFDDFSYEDGDDKDYNSYNFLEKYKEKVGQYIVELKESGRSTEGYCSLKYVQAISEHYLIREAPVHFLNV